MDIFIPHTIGHVNNVNFTRNGKYLYGYDFIYDIVSNEMKYIYNLTGRMEASLTENGRFLTSIGLDYYDGFISTIEILDVTTNEIDTLDVYDYIEYTNNDGFKVIGNAQPVNIAFSDDGSYLATSTNNWDLIMLHYGSPNYIQSRITNNKADLLFPNPANDIINIRFDLNMNQLITLNIIDMFGNTIETIYDDWHQAGEFKLNHSVKNLKSGFYMLLYNSNSFNKVYPFLKLIKLWRKNEIFKNKVYNVINRVSCLYYTKLNFSFWGLRRFNIDD